MSDLIRYAVVGEMMLLVCCVSVLHGAHGERLSRELQWMGRGMQWLTLSFAAAVGVNAATPGVPMTPGLLVLAVLASPVAAGGMWLSCRAIRAARLERRDYRLAVAHLAHLEPCANPDCVTARADLAAIARRYR